MLKQANAGGGELPKCISSAPELLAASVVLDAPGGRRRPFCGPTDGKWAGSGSPAGGSQPAQLGAELMYCFCNWG